MWEMDEDETQRRRGRGVAWRGQNGSERTGHADTEVNETRSTESDGHSQTHSRRGREEGGREGGRVGGVERTSGVEKVKERDGAGGSDKRSPGGPCEG